MPVKCRTIMEAMEELAPARLAAGWDNVGLLVGSPDQDVENVLVALDVTPALAETAAATGIDLIVAHHPLIFKALSAIRTDRPAGRTLATLIGAGVAVFAAHTNWDTADGGVSDILAARLGLGAARTLTEERRENFLKIVVFVPESHVEAVRQAMAAAGAGHIGNYSHCTFQTAGTGTFLPLAGTNPYLGQPGKLEYAAEYRLETILPEAIAGRVVKAMLAAHPYEEVAYDLYPLENTGRGYGFGRVGELEESLSLEQFAKRVKAALAVDGVRLCGPSDRPVKVVAVCGGAGGDLIADAARAGADVLVTGDVKYHEALSAADLGLTVIDAGHFATEKPAMSAVAAYLNRRAVEGSWGIAVRTDDASKDIFRFF